MDAKGLSVKSACGDTALMMAVEMGANRATILALTEITERETQAASATRDVQDEQVTSASREAEVEVAIDVNDSTEVRRRSVADAGQPIENAVLRQRVRVEALRPEGSAGTESSILYISSTRRSASTCV